MEDPGGYVGDSDMATESSQEWVQEKNVGIFLLGADIYGVKGWGNSEHFYQTWTFLLPLLYVHGNQWSESAAGIWPLRDNEKKLFQRLRSDVRELHCSWNFLQQLQGPF